MIALEPCDDFVLLNAIMRHPDVWPMVHDDRVESNYAVRQQSGRLFMLVRRNDEPVGFFVLDAMGGESVEVHTCILPRARGSDALKAALMLIDCVFHFLQQRKMITKVPVFNRAAMRFAKTCGFVVDHVDLRSFMHNGLLYDQSVMFLTREHLICQ